MGADLVTSTSKEGRLNVDDALLGAMEDGTGILTDNCCLEPWRILRFLHNVTKKDAIDVCKMAAGTYTYHHEVEG